MNAKKTLAQVERVTPLTDSIIELLLSPEDYIEYQAGQYLNMICDKEVLSYSIANAPLGSHKYELHIRHAGKNPYNYSPFADIMKRGKVFISLPFGDCHISKLDANLPIIFVAGGTGFAPIKAMIEQLLATGDQRFFELFWGARSQSDLYMDEKVKQWQAHVNHFRYFSFLPHSNEDTIAAQIKTIHQDDIKNYQVVIAGALDMVYATRDVLVKLGIPSTQLFSDAFSQRP